VIVSFLLLHAVLMGQSATPPNAGGSATPPGLYDPNPQSIWNRLNEALFIRSDQSGVRYGDDALDLLLWPDTEYLLSGQSHQRALAVLDEVLRAHAENLIRDPLKRALLQRRLWAVFDWSTQRRNHDRERRELQVRLAEVLRRLAPTRKEIDSLPDNYARALASGAFAREYDPAHRDRPFLPSDLFQPRGPWVCIRGDDGPVAESHVGGFSGRSRFLVFVRLPEGRKATLEYFASLWNVPQPWVDGQLDVGRGALNPDLPQFPVGTEVALVRQMILFDNQGTLVATPITESVELRVYRSITARHDRNNVRVDWPAARVEQDFYEVRLSPSQLVEGQAGALRAVARGEKEFPLFSTQGDDVFEVVAGRQDPSATFRNSLILAGCAACHSAPGINSVQSRRHLLKPKRRQADPDPPYDALWWESENTVSWKANRYDWGLLNGYWQAGKGLRQ
jgi:hypothetical protein